MLFYQVKQNADPALLQTYITLCNTNEEDRSWSVLTDGMLPNTADELYMERML